MTEQEVQHVAAQFVAEQSAQHHQKHGGKTWIYNFQGAKLHPRLKGQWSAVFEVRAAEGDVIDGPVVVLVDDISGEVRFLD